MTDQPGDMQSTRSFITASKAIECVQNGKAGSLIDVRTQVEFNSARVEGSTWIPLEQVGRCVEQIKSIDGPRMLFCRTDRRAKLALTTLEKLGVKDLCVVSGGLEAYRQQGGSIESSGEHMSLERQVRIAAGALVLIGVLLGTFLHPYLYGISGFVGAGLIFAGATDWCGMGLLLARMPWNRC